jgi:hypothetical protein
MRQFDLMCVVTHGLCHTIAVSSFTIPVTCSLSVERLSVPVEIERATAARSANLEERPSPIPAFISVSYTEEYLLSMT